MKIVIVSPAHPFRGGIAEFTSAMATDLLDRGHDVKLVSFSRQYPKLLFPGKTQYEHQGDVDQDLPRGEPVIDSINPFTWFKAVREIVDFQTDVVIFNYWMPFFAPCFGTIARRVKKKLGSQIFFVCHNVVPHESRPGDTVLTRYALSPADRCIVLSSPVGHDLELILPTMTYEHVPHPVYNSYGESSEKELARAVVGASKQNVILFFGFIREYKGLDMLLYAMPTILASIDCQLWVVGEFYDDEEKYRTIVDELDLKSSVEFRPEFVPRNEVSAYFSAADLVVLPYRTATQSGIVQIANHFDTPCVVTDVGGLSEVVEDDVTGFVVPPGSTEAIATAVVRFFRDTDRENMIENIRKRKGRYSWAALSEVVERLAGASGGGDKL